MNRSVHDTSVTDRKSTHGESPAMTRLILLLFAAWLSVSVSTGMDVQKRIINGYVCVREYHVRLRIESADRKTSYLCGGSLISPEWIVSAAHCHKAGVHGRVFASLNGGLAAEVEITATPVRYEEASGLKRPHDLMLLKLPATTSITPVGPPDCKHPPKNVQIAGHAATSGDAAGLRKPTEVPDLHCGDFDVIDCKNLLQSFKIHHKTFYDDWEYQHLICGQSTVVDICLGDSGGGAVSGDKIYGVNSFTGDGNRVCSKPNAMMDLCNKEYSDWIKKTTGLP